MDTKELPPARSQPLTLDALLPPVVGDALTYTFRCMEVAEDEIARAKKRHPSESQLLHEAFRYLTPTPILRSFGDELYRTHCREILELVATGEDITEGTTAEVIAALSESSHAAPLRRTATLLYMELFSLHFPAEAKRLFADGGAMEPDRYEREQMRETEAELRRKLRTDRGQNGSTVREPTPAYGREASLDDIALPAHPREVVAVREVSLRYVGPAFRSPAIRGPEEAVQFARKVVYDDSKEHLVAIYLDGRHVPIAHAIVSVGTATASLVHPREVFQPAVHVGAAAAVVLHNHPSGDPSASAEDLAVTKRLSEAGRLLGIPVLDHVIWTRLGGYVSLRDEKPEHFTL